MGFIRDVVGGVTGSSAADAAKEGGQLQYQAAQQGIDLQREMNAQQQANLSPFRNLATPSALNQYITQATTPTNYSFNPNSDPLLNNALSRTTKAIMDAQAAKGKLGSGDTSVALNQALAGVQMDRSNQLFQQQYNTQNQNFNRLTQLINSAQNAAAGQGAANSNATNNITSLLGQGANAQAAGGIGAANANAAGAGNLLGLGAMGVGAAGGMGELLYMMGLSDIRAKHDIKRVGAMDDGTPIYTYKYKGDSKTFMGVMAQDVAKSKPHAVSVHDSGYLMVNYGAL